MIQCKSKNVPNLVFMPGGLDVVVVLFPSDLLDMVSEVVLLLRLLPPSFLLNLLIVMDPSFVILKYNTYNVPFTSRNC